MIEEAMLLANACAGEFLAAHKAGLTRYTAALKPSAGEIKAPPKEELCRSTRRGLEPTERLFTAVKTPANQSQSGCSAATAEAHDARQ